MSKIEVNTIEPQCGTTLTVGASGDTITFPTGTTIVNNGTQTGFGRTGTVDWQTAIKTSTITVVNGEGYFVNTTGGAITANLPAGSAGAIASFRDYANTFDSNNLTISSNGSEKINGLTDNLVISAEGESLTLVYADATKGWLVVNDGNNDAGIQASFICASSPCVATVGNFKIHTFTGPGTFTVNSAGNPSGSNTVDYLVAAGGGGGGGACSASNWGGGGGGAGGYRFSNGTASGCYSAGPSPLGATALPVSVQGYSIVVGGGGIGRTGGGPQTRAPSGSTSTFSTITSAGGGGGGKRYGAAGDSPTGTQAGGTGGSGGGGAGLNGASYPSGVPGGVGNTPPTSPSQGNSGGNGIYSAGGGGGAGGSGATGAGVPQVPSSLTGGAGGLALASSITNAAVSRAGGGGGGGAVQTPGTPAPNGTSGGGAGGSGAGNGGGGDPQSNGAAATVNLAGGGGGGGGGAILSGVAKDGGNGGSGIVIIRYKFQ